MSNAETHAPPTWLSALAAKCRATLDALPESAQPSWYRRTGTRVPPPAECDGCLCPTEHDGDYGSSGHAGPCPPHTCGTPPGVGK